MKITHIIVGLGDGGAESTLYKLISGDKRNQHSVISLTNYGRYGENLLKFKIPLTTLNFKKNRLNLSKIYKLIKVIKKYKPDVIQSWMYHSDIVTCLIKLLFPSIKVVWGIRNSVYRAKDSYIRYFISKMCSYFSYIVPKVIISCSYQAMNEHIKLGYSKKKFRVVSNGVNLNKFFPKNNPEFKNNLLENYLFDVNKISIGMVARYDKQKGLNILIKALNILQIKDIEFNCFLVGTNMNHDNKNLVSMINEYNLNSKIFLLGQKNDIDNIYNFLDLSILSSISGEGFPNVLIESMACGTPCVATNVGDSKFIVDNTGWIAEPGDYTILASLIEKAIQEFNQKEWSQRKADCRNRIEANFDLGKMIENFNNIWSKI